MANVKDFGAVGDGITNDQAAIQACMDDSAANGSGCYVPSGSYKVSVPNYNGYSAYSNFNIKPGTVMIGEGDSSIIFRDNTQINGYMMSLNQVAHDAASLENRNYTIKDIKFRGITGLGYEAPGISNDDGGLFISSLNSSNPSNRVEIQNVTYENCNKEAIAVWHAIECKLLNNKVRNCNFDAYNPQNIERLMMLNNYSSRSNFGCEFQGSRPRANYPTFAIISGNQFVENYEYAFNIESGDNIKLSNNQFSFQRENNNTVTNQAFGVLIASHVGAIDLLEISNNSINGFVSGGINFDPSEANNEMRQLIIKGNVISASGNTAITLNPFNNTKIKNVEISGNTLYDWNRLQVENSFVFSAIALYNLTGASIFSNRIYNDLIASGEPSGKRNDPLYLNNCNNINFFNNDLTGNPSTYSNVLKILEQPGSTNTYNEWNNNNLNGGKGLDYSKMTTAQRTALVSPKAGKKVYDVGDNKEYTFDGTTWQVNW